MKKTTPLFILILISLLAALLGTAAISPSVRAADLMARFYSGGPYDGWILESTETSGVGGTLNNSAPQLYIGDDAANKQYRAILHFNTAALPDTAIITGAWVWIKRHSAVGTDPINKSMLLLDTSKLATGRFGSSTALELADFKAAGVLAGYFVYFAQADGVWYRATLQSGGIANINRTGTTQYRLRFQLDDNNNHIADYLKVYSGSATLSYRPQLAVQYYVPIIAAP
jgi:hypothetical protein